jgi:hypothetical protein
VESDADRQTEVVAKILAEQGYEILPDTAEAVRSSLQDALQNNVLESSHDVGISAAALFAAAADVAREQGTRMIRPTDVDHGWHTRLRACPGNEPPHRCLGSSVIDRTEMIREEIPLFGDIVDQLYGGDVGRLEY